jgi:hypothetical protein
MPIKSLKENNLKFEKSLIVLLVILVLPSLSMSWPRRVGLLTEDYGIVTKQDLDEEEAKFVKAEPFPSDSFRYWQCLSTQEVFMKCDNLGFIAEEFGNEAVGEPTLQIGNGEEILDFYTSHNWTLSACQEMEEQWRSIMDKQDIVCISAFYLGTEQKVAKDGHSFTHSEWEIDRMKSRHGEWSWFER